MISFISINMILKTKKTSAGFTLIEALTLLFIFSVIVTTFYSVFTAGTKYMIESKNRLGALALANEKMEIVRNLKYDDIGTVGGEIGGNIPQEEDVTENAHQFHVNTLVEYFDDPYDGLGIHDTIWFEDYKKVTVTITWDNGTSANSVKMVSRFSPHGVEKQNPNDGILSINVYSKQPGAEQTLPVEGASVHLVNSDLGLNTSKNTDADGNATFMGSNIKNSIQKYEVTLTKSGYETVSTLPPYPDTSYNPTDVHGSVVTVGGSANFVNLIQNKLANLKITAVDFLNQPIANIDFHVKGGRKMGTTISSNDPVYNLDEDSETEADGEKEFDSVSPGQYEISPTPGADYELIRISPVSPVTLFSEQSLDVKIELVNKNSASLLVSVLNNDDNSPIPGAQVQLKNDTLGYDNTQTVPTDGKVYFPTTSDLFEAGTYNLNITADGFNSSNTQVTINPGSLKLEEVKLTPSG
jgi:hypothetical protein